METITIDWNMIDNISYQTQLGKSLKNTLRKFDKEALFDEIDSLIMHMIENEENIKEEHRVKSLQSCYLKYDKYFPSTQIEKVFNDVLGIRIIVDSYDVVDNIKLPDFVKMADMRNGKANDDGYSCLLYTSNTSWGSSSYIWNICSYNTRRFCCIFLIIWTCGNIPFFKCQCTSNSEE